MKQNCTLCESGADLFWQQKSGVSWKAYHLEKNAPACLNFYKCSICDLIFKDPKIYLSAEFEKARYETHQSGEGQQGYENFLQKIILQMEKNIKRGMYGLDFGSGRDATLAKILGEKNILCESYDPIFFPKVELLEKSYDFVFCTEAVEHFYSPQKEFQLLEVLLKPMAYLGIMTQLAPSDFQNWWYHRDPTHVAFYSEKTFQWIADKFFYQLEFHAGGVILLQKS